MKQYEFLYNFGYIGSIPNPKALPHLYGRYIPTHSFLFNSMVTAGILGGLFWFFLTYFIVKNYANYANSLPFFFHFWIINYFYNLIFSPWGAVTRAHLSVVLVLFILYIELMENNKPRQQDERIN